MGSTSFFKEKDANLRNDPRNLRSNHYNKSNSHPQYGSIEGHIEDYNNHRRGTLKLLDYWRRSECDNQGGPKLPQDASRWATPPAYQPPNPQESSGAARSIAVAGGVGVGVYVTYRVVRMAPSVLIPSLWPTIPVNAAVP